MLWHMETSSSNTLTTDAELQAALADTDTVPSLDEGGGPAIVPIPVQPLARPYAAPAADNPAPGDMRSAGAQQPETAGAQQPEAPGAVASVPTVPQSRRLPTVVAPLGWVGHVLFRSADLVLWAVNRPFERLSNPARGLIGWLAIVTIVISAAALLALPRLGRPQDVYSQIKARRTAAGAKPETPPAAAPAAHANPKH